MFAKCQLVTFSTRTFWNFVFIFFLRAVWRKANFCYWVENWNNSNISSKFFTSVVTISFSYPKSRNKLVCIPYKKFNWCKKSLWNTIFEGNFSLKQKIFDLIVLQLLGYILILIIYLVYLDDQQYRLFEAALTFIKINCNKTFLT